MTTQLTSIEKFINIQKAQAGLTKLLISAQKTGNYYRVLKNDKPLGVLIPEDMWMDFIEDMEALASPNYIKSIAKARKEKTYSAEEVKKMLGL